MQKTGKLDKYFWDCFPPAGKSAFRSGNMSDAFKLKRLFEYAGFPDLLKIPFDFVKANIDGIDMKNLRTSGNRITFLQRIREVAKGCDSWDQAIYKISGIKK